MAYGPSFSDRSSRPKRIGPRCVGSGSCFVLVYRQDGEETDTGLLPRKKLDTLDYLSAALVRTERVVRQYPCLADHQQGAKKSKPGVVYRWVDTYRISLPEVDGDGVDGLTQVNLILARANLGPASYGVGSVNPFAVGSGEEKKRAPVARQRAAELAAVAQREELWHYLTLGDRSWLPFVPVYTGARDKTASSGACHRGEPAVPSSWGGSATLWFFLCRESREAFACCYLAVVEGTAKYNRAVRSGEIPGSREEREAWLSRNVILDAYVASRRDVEKIPPEPNPSPEQEARESMGPFPYPLRGEVCVPTQREQDVTGRLTEEGLIRP